MRMRHTILVRDCAAHSSSSKINRPLSGGGGAAGPRALASRRALCSVLAPAGGYRAIYCGIAARAASITVRTYAFNEPWEKETK